MRTFVKAIIPVILLASFSSVSIGAGQTAAGQPAGTAPQTDPPAVSQAFSGSELFRTYCAACHGKSGQGDGPLAEHMKRRPPDLTQFAAQNGGTYPSALVGRIIDGRSPMPGHGGPDMPVWGDAFKRSRDGSTEASVKARIDALVEHIESLQRKNAQVVAPPPDATTR
jgi:mono/diheme cytochrome c family protein